MGLSEQKSRLVFGADPRNRNWSDDKGRFGFKMLEKMGWSEGKGLGANEDGVKEHVKIKLKTNNFGVGADKKNIRNWLANADGFSELLNRLNSESATPAEPAGEKEEEEESKKNKKSKKDKKDKKHKKEEKKKDRKESPDSDSKPADNKDAQTQQVISAASARLSRLSHRAKFRHMKQMATRDAKGLQEIFGVRSNPSYDDNTPVSVTEPASTTEQSGSSTPKNNTVETGVSVTDYFAQKMMDNPALAAIYGGATAVGSKRESASSDENSDSDVEMKPPSKKSKTEKKEKKDKKDKKDKKRKEKKSSKSK
ncbi:hypothetical protein FB645_000892 [Coemansia sp. IMI 203386]|nr:hypothetical protein FB645_000892 [Coemansia sp. IMI 203386]